MQPERPSSEAQAKPPTKERGRIRSGLRRHGLARRPKPLRSPVRQLGLRFTEGNRARLFHEGRSALADMLHAIEAAGRRVHLETYILRTDRIGRRFLGALSERAKAGVEVRLLYDALGSIGLDPAALAPLRSAGGEIVAFNPLQRFYPRWAPRRRDHRKILSIDGRVAFAGGLNIGDEYWGLDGQEVGWRDTHVRIEGPAVRDLDAVFLESWFRADGPDLPWHDLLEPQAPEEVPLGGVSCAVVSDGPAYRRRRMRELLLGGLAESRSSARFATPYFSPGRKVLKGLIDASVRGIDVDLMLAGVTDHPILRRAARAFLPRLLPSGVRVHEYHRAVMHAKVALFDERWAIVGSSNLDRQSFEHSYEVNLVLQGDDVADEIASAFDRDLASSTPLDASSLAARSFFDRAVDRVASWLLRFF